MPRPLYSAPRMLDAIADRSTRYPLMRRVRQRFDPTRVADVEAAAHASLRRSEIQERIPDGGRVAIGVGSRGLAQLPALVRAIVHALQDAGAEPFIVPAMGSHGGATAEGQARLLAEYGVTESNVGAPIRASMEAVLVGHLDHGGQTVPLYMDRFAHEADGFVLLNRVKPHTCFRGRMESGIGKMLTIGLGKRQGASSLHHQGFGRFAELLPTAAQYLIGRSRFLFGVATVENAFDEVGHVEAIVPERLLAREPELLEEARARMGRLLLPELDLLIVDEIGKDISGDGMDPNVTGRSPGVDVKGDIQIQKIVVLGLTAKSGGNAIGIGMADITTQEVLDQIDFVQMYTNGITSTVLTTSRLPVVMPSRESAITLGLTTLNGVTPERASVIRIQNTLALHEIEMSETLWKNVSGDDRFEALGEPAPMRVL